MLDLRSRPIRIHVVGVGGPGMSAIAIVLAQMGHRVSGSDVRNTEVLDVVRAVGVTVSIGHDAAIVADCDVVTHSTAVPKDNVEIVAALAAGRPVLNRADVLAAICGSADSYGVAGTHGKTTTSSLLRSVLAADGRRPGYVIGGEVRDTGRGAEWTGSREFVVEADESDGTHLRLPLRGAIVTNVDRDHLDHFGSFAALCESFARFVDGVDGPVVVCADDPYLAALIPKATASYGSGPESMVRWHDVRPEGARTEFTISSSLFGERRVDLALRGVHNVANATGVIAFATTIGVDVDRAVAALADFGGVGRRFDVRGSAGGATFVDDYAHLPREIAAVLAAARGSGEWKRVVAVFQPNRYNRMAVMSDEYADAFVEADVAVIADIYSSGTAPIEGVTGRLVVDAVQRAHPTARVVWAPERDRLADVVDELVRPGDVCVSMGCGDIEGLPDEVMARREGR